jgi:rhamnopyranosyl-N-acetylglucosaminyl-diphospho-decaprenol beta-1,3/1,4-galactofuranosyltransferase
MTGTPDGHGSVAAVVVTYNRKDYLEKLLPSLLASHRPLDAIYVIDNNSTDGTQAFLTEHYDDVPAVHVVLLDTNTGGSGGFYTGVKEAYAGGHDWFWLMDDDVTAIPDGLEGLLRYSHRSGCIHGRRIDFHGGPFFWQQRMNEFLGIPMPALHNPFKDGNDVFETNCGVFEGMLVSREVVAKIGPPDPRFFITTDDAVYALLASTVTTVTYVDHFSLQRQRAQRQVSLKVRHLNDASDLFRFHIMRNRGYMAHVLRYLGTYNVVGFALGTFLTFGKELLRLVYVQHTLKGAGTLVRGWRESRRLLRQSWEPISTSELDAPHPAA